MKHQSPNPVHPRLRGELRMRTTSKTFHNGSSPLTRGTPVQTASIRGLLRFIPAYAGNSACKLSRRQISPVHPRLRGELPYKQKLRFPVGGSSPLTRGTLRRSRCYVSDYRFIPAYAGNSATFSLLPRTPSVHPRLRGELTALSSDDIKKIGSSPLTRGTHLNKA